SAHCHLGALRVAPAAAGRGDPGLAQRRHLAAGRRPWPLAQPADASDAGAAGTRGTRRRCGAHLHVAVGRGPNSDRPWLTWAQARNAVADRAKPVRAPEPRPPLELRPRKLSVTTIEKWI